jgi:hypothetical protein
MGLLGDGRHHGASVASRWPILAVHEVDLHLTPRTGNYSCRRSWTKWSPTPSTVTRKWL